MEISNILIVCPRSRKAEEIARNVVRRLHPHCIRVEPAYPTHRGTKYIVLILSNQTLRRTDNDAQSEDGDNFAFELREILRRIGGRPCVFVFDGEECRKRVLEHVRYLQIDVIMNTVVEHPGNLESIIDEVAVASHWLDEASDNDTLSGKASRPSGGSLVLGVLFLIGAIILARKYGPTVGVAAFLAEVTCLTTYLVRLKECAPPTFDETDNNSGYILGRHEAGSDSPHLTLNQFFRILNQFFRIFRWK